MSKKNFTPAFEKIAAAHKTTVEDVRQEIEIAIRTGFHNPDSKVQEQWAKIPQKGDIPTPEELIAYVVRQAKKDKAKSHYLPRFKFF